MLVERALREILRWLTSTTHRKIHGPEDEQRPMLLCLGSGRLALSVNSSANSKAPAMRHLLAVLMLLASAPLVLPLRKTVTSSTSKSCRQLILNFSVDSTILQSDGSYEVYLSNGTTYTQVQGCTGCRPTREVRYACGQHDDGKCATAALSTVRARQWTATPTAWLQIGDQCWFAENLRYDGVCG